MNPDICQHTAPAVIGERCIMIDVRTPKAIKNHSCNECHRVIHKGEEYRREILKFGSKLFHHLYCDNCLSVREVFFSAGWYYGNLWEDMIDFIFSSDGKLSEHQLTQLTKKARDKICDMMENYWNESEIY